MTYYKSTTKIKKTMKHTKEYQIKTTSDLQLSVHRVKCTTIDSTGRHPKPDEIGLNVKGYIPEIDRDIDSFVIITKEEAKNLIFALENFISE